MKIEKLISDIKNAIDNQKGYYSKSKKCEYVDDSLGFGFKLNYLKIFFKHKKIINEIRILKNWTVDVEWKNTNHKDHQFESIIENLVESFKQKILKASFKKIFKGFKND